jgi:uncharacterized membrane protein
MARTEVTRTIDAPVGEVFDTVAHIDSYSKAVPHITEVEFLTEQRRGVGTRFSETRVLRGRQASTTLEVTEYVAGERIRLVSDEGGTIWDTVFTVSEVEVEVGLEADAERTRLHMAMDARPYTFIAKILNPLTRGIIRRSIEGDMDAVKAYCEANAGEGANADAEPDTEAEPGPGDEPSSGDAAD